MLHYFGVSASCFAANMSVRQNAADYSYLYPLAAHVAEILFYADDCLTGADSYRSAVALREQLQELFNLGCFTLSAVLETVPPDLRDSESVLSLSLIKPCLRPWEFNGMQRPTVSMYV